MAPRKLKSFLFNLEGLGSKAPFLGMGALVILCAALFAGCGKGAEGGKEASDTAKLEAAVKALSGPDESDKLGGLTTLSGMPEGAKPHAAKVVALLKDTSKEVRQATINLLVTMKHTDPEALKELSALATSDAEADVQTTALQALSDLGAYDDWVNVCKTFLAGDDANKRQAAAMSLSQSEKPAKGAQAELIAGIKDKDPVVRESCAMALGALGVDATAEAKTALQTAAGDKEKSVAAAAKEALGKLK